MITSLGMPLGLGNQDLGSHNSSPFGSRCVCMCVCSYPQKKISLLRRSRLVEPVNTIAWPRQAAGPPKGVPGYGARAQDHDDDDSLEQYLKSLSKSTAQSVAPQATTTTTASASRFLIKPPPKPSAPQASGIQFTQHQYTSNANAMQRRPAPASDLSSSSSGWFLWHLFSSGGNDSFPVLCSES